MIRRLPLAAMLWAGAAHASGVEHVVDDAAVETPGACHFESWTTRLSGGRGIAVAAPACTRRAWPDLELGGFISHAWEGRTRDTLIGVTPKYVFRSENRGLGLGIGTSAGWDLARARFESASAIALITLPERRRVRVNLNAGWQWTRAGGHDAFAGVQVEYAARRNLSLMAETFGRDTGRIGGQLGMRWTPGGGRVDLDLATGRWVDGVSRNAVSVGLAIRR